MTSPLLLTEAIKLSELFQVTGPDAPRTVRREEDVTSRSNVSELIAGLFTVTKQDNLLDPITAVIVKIIQ